MSEIAIEMAASEQVVLPVLTRLNHGNINDAIARFAEDLTFKDRGSTSRTLLCDAIETPLAQGLALERNLFLKLCISEAGLARMRSYEEKKITSPSRSFEI